MSLLQIFKKVIIKVLQGFIWLYRVFISTMLGPNCRYHPTCSVYAHQALEKHGVLKGIWLSARRICNCHPWGKKNWRDPVPDQFAWRDILRYKRASEKNEVSEDLPG